MSFDTYAYFYVREFDGPAETISKLLELIPSSTWLKNDPNPRGRLRKFSNWEIHSPLPRSEVFQDRHLAALVEVLESKRERVLQAISKFNCGLQCVGYYTNENPGFHMDAGLISRIAAFGLSVDFDLYCTRDHEET